MNENQDNPGLALNRLAREQMKLSLLRDIKVDMAVCELEGLDKTEYIKELRELLDSFDLKGGMSQ